MKKLIFIVLIFMALTASAFAADWDDSSKATLQDEFSHRMDPVIQKDADKMVSAVPPGVLAFLAKYHNIDEEKFKVDVRAFMQRMANSTKSLDYNNDPALIEYEKAENGELYALIPYKGHILTTDGRNLDEDSVIFALKNNDKWYFADLGNPLSIEAIKNVYPQFKDARFTLKGQ